MSINITKESIRQKVCIAILKESAKTTIGQKIKAGAVGTSIGLTTAALGLIGTGNTKFSLSAGAAAGVAAGASQLKKDRKRNEARISDLHSMIDRGEDLIRKWRTDKSSEAKEQISNKEAQLRKWKTELAKLEK